MLVLSVGSGVAGFTLDPIIGEFYLTHPDIRVPETTREFAINASNSRFWEQPVRRYVDECLAGRTGPRGADFNMRWIASLVAETHRILMRGGVFLYPRDRKDPARPGRLRLLYECNPIGFLDRAGRRPRQHRRAPGARGPARVPAPAHRLRVRLEGRGRAHRALPPRTDHRRRTGRTPPVPRPLAVPRHRIRSISHRGTIMSERHPIVAITGSSGAGTSTVQRTFEEIFRRENVTAAVIEGDSFTPTTARPCARSSPPAKSAALAS